MYLITHLLPTRLGVTILVTNHINLSQLYQFAVIEMEPNGEGINITFHDCDGTEDGAFAVARKIKAEIDTLVDETAKPVETVSVPWQHS